MSILPKKTTNKNDPPKKNFPNLQIGPTVRVGGWISPRSSLRAELPRMMSDVRNCCCESGKPKKEVFLGYFNHISIHFEFEENIKRHFKTTTIQRCFFCWWVRNVFGYFWMLMNKVHAFNVFFQINVCVALQKITPFLPFRIEMKQSDSWWDFRSKFRLVESDMSPYVQHGSEFSEPQEVWSDRVIHGNDWCWCEDELDQDAGIRMRYHRVTGTLQLH